MDAEKKNGGVTAHV